MSSIGTIEIERLQNLALEARRMILMAASRGGCFVGSAFSAVDIILYLYEHFLKGTPEDNNRDYFFLSKGHAVAALYSVLTLKGLISKDWINNHLSPLSNIYWHPNTNIRGVETPSGSLGHLPALAAGVALDLKMSGSKARVIVLTGDGELNEGSVWEAFLFAQSQGLDNLTVVVDRNMLQANMPTETLIPLEPLKDKFEAFGFSVSQIQGHNFSEISETFSSLPMSDKRPNAIIACTVRGKGLPSIDNRLDRWFMRISQEEAENLIAELECYHRQGVGVL